jgi:uncharacterized protein YdaU (DUF1376 family)
MADFPAMPLWTDAYLGDAYHLSTEEHGAYFLLLIAAWRTPDCRLRDDDKFLARVVKANQQRWNQRLRPAIEGFWDISDGFWTQKRLLKEREKARAICEKRSRLAREMWKAKRLKTLESIDANADANGMQYARATPYPPSSYEEESSYSNEYDSDAAENGRAAHHPKWSTKQTDEALEIWREELGDRLPGVLKLTGTRRANLRGRLSDLKSLENWRRYCRKIRNTPFLVGDNDRNWHADFDWTVKLANMAKVLEGRYERQLV